MIEYAKQILPKVSNWKDLFRKELIKSIEWASPGNRDKMYDWCYLHYADLHLDILEEVFPDKMIKSSQVERNKTAKTTTAISVYRNPVFVNFLQKQLEKIKA